MIRWIVLRRAAAIAAVMTTAALGLGVRPARADEQFDVVVGKGEITVVAKGPWHVNKDYPWRVIVGDKTIDKSKFAIAETTAKVTGVPPGTARLKGAVCEGNQCMPFTKEVAVE